MLKIFKSFPNSALFMAFAIKTDQVHFLCLTEIEMHFCSIDNNYPCAITNQIID